MGELSKADAEKKKNKYISKIQDIKSKVREDFEEMDFKNAKERTKMEGYIKSMEEEYTGLINVLNGMSFE